MGRLSNPPLAGGVRGSVIGDISVGAICDIVTNLVTANNVSGRWAFYSSVRKCASSSSDGTSNVSRARTITLDSLALWRRHGYWVS